MTPWSLHHDFYTLFSPTYQGYDTLTPAPWFLHLVFFFMSRFLHSATVFTPCFLLFKSKFQHPAKVSTPCFSSLKTCLLMSEHLVTYLLQSLLSFQKLHFKILWISSYVLHNNKFDDWKEDIAWKNKTSKRQSITSFSSCIHAFHDLDIYNNVWFLVLKNKKTCFLSCITICMSYHRVMCWHLIQKATESWHHDTGEYFHALFLLKESIYKKSSSWHFSNWWSSSFIWKTYISSKLSFVLAIKPTLTSLQAVFYLA